MVNSTECFDEGSIPTNKRQGARAAEPTLTGLNRAGSLWDGRQCGGETDWFPHMPQTTEPKPHESNDVSQPTRVLGHVIMIQHCTGSAGTAKRNCNIALLISLSTCHDAGVCESGLAVRECAPVCFGVHIYVCERVCAHVCDMSHMHMCVCDASAARDPELRSSICLRSCRCGWHSTEEM